MKRIREPKEPSQESLREIPEVDFATAKVRRNPYAPERASKAPAHARGGQTAKAMWTPRGVAERERDRPLKRAPFRASPPGLGTGQIELGLDATSAFRKALLPTRVGWALRGQPSR